ncbi:SH3 domain-containing protein [Dongshaea marina]|uniref:SH3 domain-containing protein n=1 Tax=Dongshaea marina TaxID=2047966 RepID=UPI00131EEC28|nr:SH3 domain-containing protein [Dongshaea marina]
MDLIPMKRLWAAGVLLLISHTVFASQRVSLPVTNLFKSPALESPVVSQALYGEKIRVLQTKPHWLYVETPDQYRGWVARSAVAQTDHYYKNSQPLTTANRQVHIYQTPSTAQHKPLLTLPFGVELAAQGSSLQGQQRWIEVKLLDGKKAWIQRGISTRGATIFRFHRWYAFFGPSRSPNKIDSDH